VAILNDKEEALDIKGKIHDLLHSIQADSGFESRVYIYAEGSLPDLMVSEKTTRTFDALSYGITNTHSVLVKIIHKKWISKL
jgi:hypothetical protein